MFFSCSFFINNLFLFCLFFIVPRRLSPSPAPLNATTGGGITGADEPRTPNNPPANPDEEIGMLLTISSSSSSSLKERRILLPSSLIPCAILSHTNRNNHNNKNNSDCRANRNVIIILNINKNSSKSKKFKNECNFSTSWTQCVFILRLLIECNFCCCCCLFAIILFVVVVKYY